MLGTGHGIRANIVLEVNDSPITLYIWAQLVATTMIDQLRNHGIIVREIKVDVDDLTQ